MSRPTLDVLGKRFGRLVVTKRNGVDAHRRAMWACRCDCGATCDVTGVDLKKGTSRSCGCLRLEVSYVTKVSPGQKYGRLCVIERRGSAKGKSLWLCRCVCNQDCIVQGVDLVAGVTRSCGCLQRDTRKINGKRRRGTPILSRRRPAPTYSAVHHRLTFDKGKASTHRCVDCGRRAEDWSYIGGDVDEMSSKQGPYSLIADLYVPRCKSCHKKHDLKMSGKLPATTTN